jgi:hypothetical protein
LLEEVLLDWTLCGFDEGTNWSWVRLLGMLSSHGGECVHVFGLEGHLFEFGRLGRNFVGLGISLGFDIIIGLDSFLFHSGIKLLLSGLLGNGVEHIVLLWEGHANFDFTDVDLLALGWSLAWSSSPFLGVAGSTSLHFLVLLLFRIDVGGNLAHNLVWMGNFFLSKFLLVGNKVLWSWLRWSVEWAAILLGHVALFFDTLLVKLGLFGIVDFILKCFYALVFGDKSLLINWNISVTLHGAIRNFLIIHINFLGHADFLLVGLVSYSVQVIEWFLLESNGVRVSAHWCKQ